MSRGRDMVLKVLQDAASQNPEILKPAETQLKFWETEPGFHLTLIEIFSDHSLNVSVRWIAVIYFKNGVDRYWRKNAPHAIAEDEKAQIRFGLMQNLNEPISEIAIQVAVLIARLARVDFPKDWSELLPELIERTKVEIDLVCQRALLTLHHVIKQLSSKRLAGDRRIFQDLTSQMFGYLLQFWNSRTEAFLSIDKMSPDFSSNLDRSRLALKILRKLCVHGFKKPHEHNEVAVFMQQIFEKLKVVIELRKQNESIEKIKDLLEKYIVLLTKILLDLLENHPFSFLQFIKPSLEFALYYVFTSEGQVFLFQRLVVQCLNLMKAIIVCPEYKPCKVLKDTENMETLQAYKLKGEFFNKEVAVCICNKIVSQYFLLTKEDLELWDADPESYSLESEGGESWKYSLRPCTESLFVSLLYECRKFLTPAILEMVQASNKPVQPDDFEGICQKDAIYNAVGLAAFDLFDEIDFDQWFTSTLINELKVKGCNYRILRRRVIWLIARWSSVKFCSENRTILYEAIIHLLSSEEDFVVRISAALTLKSSVDDFEFDSDQFMPYLPSLFGLLFDLLKEGQECETKMQILHVMSFLIEVVGSNIQPHAGPLLQYLPALWLESQNHDMLRCAILTTLVFIVTGLMKESEGLHGFLLSVIQMSTDVNEPGHIYLLEEGLQLWLVTLENCHTPSESLLDLFSNMLPLLEDSSDNLRTCLQITNAYIVLCPETFLSKFGLNMIQLGQELLSDLKSDGLVLVLKTFEMMLRVLPMEAPQLLQPILPRFIKVLIQDDVYPMVLSMYLSFVARLILYADATFTWAISKVAEETKKTAEEVLQRLLDVWANKLSLVSPEERRKLCALGLTQLCGTTWSPVIKTWPLAVTSIAEVVFDMTIVETKDDKLVTSSRLSSSPDLYERETEHAQRIQAIARQDPVHTTSLRSFLGERLKVFEQAVGSTVVADLFQHVEDDCKQLIVDITSS